MKIPTVHLNGTSRVALLEQMENVMSALVRASEAVEQAAPNARDYYVQGSSALGEAEAEHRARLAKLLSLRAEYAVIWEAIDV